MLLTEVVVLAADWLSIAAVTTNSDHADRIAVKTNEGGNILNDDPEQGKEAGYGRGARGLDAVAALDGPSVALAWRQRRRRRRLRDGDRRGLRGRSGRSGVNTSGSGDRKERGGDKAGEDGESLCRKHCEESEKSRNCASCATGELEAQFCMLFE